MEKLNPALEAKHDALGLGAVVALCGTVLAVALVFRARRASPPRVLDLGILALGTIGAIVMGRRMLHLRRATIDQPETEALERFSHPAINVQRVSHA